MKQFEIKADTVIVYHEDATMHFCPSEKKYKFDGKQSAFEFFKENHGRSIDFLIKGLIESGHKQKTSLAKAHDIFRSFDVGNNEVKIECPVFAFDYNLIRQKSHSHTFIIGDGEIYTSHLITIGCDGDVYFFLDTQTDLILKVTKMPF